MLRKLGKEYGKKLDPTQNGYLAMHVKLQWIHSQCKKPFFPGVLVNVVMVCQQ